MLIHEMKDRFGLYGALKIQDCIKHSRTLAFKRKYEKALKRVETFLERAKNPVISCGGGKDSTAVSIIARNVCPNIQIVCADPPNPLSDRESHVQNLLAWLGEPFIRIPYTWDVNAVLKGEKNYPEGLKMRTLQQWHKDKGIDGVILGLRKAESNTRRRNFEHRGYIYAVQNGWRCQPIADMSAAEVLCVALLHDAPVNPVYTKQTGDINFEHIRDGTWWPHGFVDNSAWVRQYYPEHYESHALASIVYNAHKSRVCEF